MITPEEAVEHSIQRDIEEVKQQKINIQPWVNDSLTRVEDALKKQWSPNRQRIDVQIPNPPNSFIKESKELLVQELNKLGWNASVYCEYHMWYVAVSIPRPAKRRENVFPIPANGVVSSVDGLPIPSGAKEEGTDIPKKPWWRFW